MKTLTTEFTESPTESSLQGCHFQMYAWLNISQYTTFVNKELVFHSGSEISNHNKSKSESEHDKGWSDQFSCNKFF